MLRRGYLEQAWDPALSPRELTDLLGSREMLHKSLRRDFKDERLRLVASHPFVIDGHDLRNVPARMGVTSYLEQTFGARTVPGGLAAIGAALADRLATREVTVERGTSALDLVLRDGRVVAVRTDAGDLDADAVVCAIDPRRLPALAGFVHRTMPAIPPVIAHVGLEGDVPDLPHEVVLHGDPMLVVRANGPAWDDHRPRPARRGRAPRSRGTGSTSASRSSPGSTAPRSTSSTPGGGSPLGLLWQGRATVRDRLGPTTPIPGVYAAGAHATPGSGLPFVGLSAALVAEAIGPS
ncbi:FAD-dependent oxidoreductase [Nocardioides sp. B-3]|uniref:FAD-dependent oxidoreductase n=1 Tax=Nocardioides sp. B-3 TaxID=2895565 RepID=UPI002152D49A|nr:FAD-dependent oxidoreductase [Nocardioides sp. B-3]UUZ59671.1 hypothetical protein LP418_00500 [Nocardioides sp. B-3]